jgi:hypothetical protein
VTVTAQARQDAVVEFRAALSLLDTLRAHKDPQKRVEAYGELSHAPSIVLATALYAMSIAGARFMTSDTVDEADAHACLMLEAGDICDKWLLGSP